MISVRCSSVRPAKSALSLVAAAMVARAYGLGEVEVVKPPAMRVTNAHAFTQLGTEILMMATHRDHDKLER